MPRKSKPSELPSTVRERATRTRKRSASPPPSPGILVSDPRATEPESPQRSPRPSRALVPLPPCQPEPQDCPETSECAGFVQNPSQPDGGALAWWEQQVSPVVPAPVPARGKVAVRLHGSNLQIATQDADLAFEYDPNTGLALPEGDIESDRENSDVLKLLTVSIVALTSVAVLVLVGFWVNHPRVIVVPQQQESPHAPN